MSRTTALLELQRIDLRRDEVADRSARVRAALKGGSAVREARRRVEAAETRARDVEKSLRAVELERQSLKERIAAEERKLYGGTVTSPKELQGFEREVASLKRRLAALDDNALEQMLARDEAASSLTASRTELASAESRVSANRQALEQQRDALASADGRLAAERARVVATIAAPDLALYERLRPSKWGRAVAVLGSEGCGECGMELPRHTRDEASDGDSIVLCPGCGRILHA